MSEKKKCVEVCVEGGKKIRICPTGDGKTMTEEEIGKC